MKLSPAGPTNIGALSEAVDRLVQAADSLLGGDSLLGFTQLAGTDVASGDAQPHAGTPWGVKASQGQRPNMEDAYSVQVTQPSPNGVTAPQLCSQESDSSECISIIPEDLAVLSVFDGHGGTEVAEHCRERLHRHFAQALGTYSNTATSQQGTAQSQDSSSNSEETNTSREGGPASSSATTLSLVTSDSKQASSLSYKPSHVGEALKEAFLKTDQELAGTEAGDFGTHVLSFSEVVMQRHSLKIINRTEKTKHRIKAAGGRIVFNSGSYRVMGMLAMSRAIGDHFLRPYVIAEPEVACVERTPLDEVLVLATDGLWDVFTSKEATTLAQRCISRSKERGMSRHGACRVAASVLTKVALERGSRDNITVIVVDVSFTLSASPHTPAAHPHTVAAGRLRPHASDSEAGASPLRTGLTSGKTSPQVTLNVNTSAEPCAHSVPNVTSHNPDSPPPPLSLPTPKPPRAAADEASLAHSIRIADKRSGDEAGKALTGSAPVAAPLLTASASCKELGKSGMGNRTNSFSVSSCTFLKSNTGSRLDTAGLGTTATTTSPSPLKGDADTPGRGMNRQSSAPNNIAQQAAQAGDSEGQQHAGGQQAGAGGAPGEYSHNTDWAAGSSGAHPSMTSVVHYSSSPNLQCMDPGSGGSGSGGGGGQLSSQHTRQQPSPTSHQLPPSPATFLSPPPTTSSHSAHRPGTTSTRHPMSRMAECHTSPAVLPSPTTSSAAGSGASQEPVLGAASGGTTAGVQRSYPAVLSLASGTRAVSSDSGRTGRRSRAAVAVRPHSGAGSNKPVASSSGEAAAGPALPKRDSAPAVVEDVCGAEAASGGVTAAGDRGGDSPSAADTQEQHVAARTF